MSGTKRTRSPSTHDAAADAAVAVLEKPSAVVPVDIDEFDDILGEIVEPTALDGEGIADEPADEDDDFADILGELDEPAETEASDGLDDALDAFSDVSEPAPAEDLSEIPGSVASEAADPSEPADTSEADATPDAVPSPEKAGLAAKARKLAGAAGPRLAGTREISRRAYAGGIAAIALLTLVSVGQAAVILSRPAAVAAGHGRQDGGHEAAAALPVNYAQVDLDRFLDKTRALPEGGRQMLRNPAVKAAILELDSGEDLYRQLNTLAAQSPAADLVAIGHNRVRIASCNTPSCPDKTFRLTYDIERKSADVCVTEKYLGGTYLSYRYGPKGYGEVPHCG